MNAFLQRAVGYTLYGDPREQVILMVNGPGGTGKSTFISVIQSVLADYATTADFSTFSKKDRVNGGASDDVASLAGHDWSPPSKWTRARNLRRRWSNR